MTELAERERTIALESVGFGSQAWFDGCTVHGIATWGDGSVAIYVEGPKDHHFSNWYRPPADGKEAILQTAFAARVTGKKVSVVLADERENSAIDEMVLW